jgi:hypothetical protein
LREKIKKQIKKKDKKVIKRMRTKLDKNIKWNKMFRDEIAKQKTLKCIKINLNRNQIIERQNWNKYKLENTI